MPKISLVSDIHLEFGYQELPGGDVLILAGDICEVKSISKEKHIREFFDKECSKYEKVFYVMGNHEHYRNRLDKTREHLEKLIPPNIKILENEYEIYQGILFIGATLWTNCNKANPVTMFTLKSMMNDYRVIRNHYKEKNLYHKLTPEHTVNVHRDTLEFFKNTIKSNLDKKVIVITHHAPSFASVPDRFKKEFHMNGAYASSLDDFILDTPNIAYWFHGHIHDSVNYQIGTCSVVSNPRGYHKYDENEDFDKHFLIQV